MASELAPIDIRQIPELARLVDEVRASRKPRRIMRDDEEVALLVPVRPATRRRTAVTPEDDAAFLASAGSWQDVDTDTLLTGIYESRRSSRPPVDL
jgi:hypothetical protein